MCARVTAPSARLTRSTALEGVSPSTNCTYAPTRLFSPSDLSISSWGRATADLAVGHDGGHGGVGAEDAREQGVSVRVVGKGVARAYDDAVDVGAEQLELRAATETRQCI